ncbi:MAG: aminotransferase class V-fold PLP-dependent enzyme [Candidatus Nanopelagicus sp.]|nr:aminotransferase class V-fold PLP-dependent enzyme [Candidatus Nanopelagicus sp.]
MHQFTAEVEELAKEVLEYSLIRLRTDPPLDGPKTAQELYDLAGNTITEKGLGGHEALKLFKDVLAKACISTDHPRYLAFIPSAPSEYANLFDLVVGASALYGGSWLEGAGAVFAENQALKWISDLAGMPNTAGGVFVQGGTIGNLSALVTARNTFRNKRKDVTRWVIAASADSHSSVKSAAEVMDVGILLIKPDKDGILQGSACEVAIDKYHQENPSHQVFALVATAGTTNLGIIDNLKSISVCAKERGIWFHVDGAYGLAALCAPSVRPLFDGVEMADSLIVDPHKWLFAPFDACALIYRNPKLAKKAHLQKAAYLETLDEDDEWNPSDYAIHLTRRARGLPFWFSLAAHGTAEYAKAMERTMEVAKNAAEQVRNHPNLKLLMEPTLSIVAFERVGWAGDDYEKWSDKLLVDQIGFVTPSAHKGKPILRFAIVNPWTSESDISEILATL